MNHSTVRLAVDGASPLTPPSPLTFEFVREHPRVRHAGRGGADRDRRDRQPPRERRRPGERRGRGADPRRQERRAPHPRAQSRHDQVRHPRPRELRGGEELPQRGRGPEAHHARAHDRSQDLPRDGVLRDLHDADARVTEGGEAPRGHVRPAGERQPPGLGAVCSQTKPDPMSRRSALNQRFMVAVASIAVLLFGAGVASARNPHCAGGIQYVVQGLRDKDRGMTEDYQREMNKAVDQLTQCSTEDPADLEAVGYLGWALAEVDSCGPAGAAFQKAIDGLTAKGDKKKVDPVAANRDHYWSAAY